MSVKNKGVIWLVMVVQLIIIMVVLLLYVSFGFGIARASQTPEQVELIQVILETHKYTESLLKNVMFRVEFENDIAPGVIDEDQIWPVHRVKKLKYIYEPKGRIRVEEQVLEVKGLEMPIGNKTTWIDNLKEERTFNEGSGYLRFLSIQKRSGLVHSFRKPTFFVRSGAKLLSQLIQGALDDELPIKVNRQQEIHSAHIALSVSRRLNDDIYEYVYWLDPQKLYYPLKIETYRNGKLIRIRKSIPQHIQDDIWMPLEASYESFDSEGQRLENMTMKVEEVKVNMPELPDSLFDIEILQGTRVVDSRGSETVEYMVGVGHEADMMLEELAAAVLRDEHISSYRTKRNKTIRVRPSSIKLDKKSNESNVQSVVSKDKKIENDDRIVSKRESHAIDISNKIPYFTYLLLAIFIILIVTAVLIWHSRQNKIGSGRGKKR